MPSTYFDETRAKIDAEILQLRLRILVLSSQRNTLAPIARLPPEVLAKIFVEFHNDSKISQRMGTPDLLTWVCRHWREVAINYPALWSQIGFHHPPSVELYLARSNKLALTISISDLPDNAPPSILVMLQQLPRIEGLSLSSNTDRCNIDELNRAWDFPAPILETLILDGIDLPSDAFQGRIPRLEHIAMSFSNVPLEAPIFSNLTILAIVGPTTGIALREFLPVLRQSPRLTQLELLDAFDTSADPPDHVPEGPVVLSGLKLLSIPHEDCMVAVDFLRNLSLPDAVQARITISCTFYAAPICSSQLTPRLALGHDPDISTVQIFRPQESLAIILRFQHELSPPPNLGPLALAHLGLESLQHLTLDSSSNYPEPLCTLYGRLPQLRIIEVKTFAAISFMSFLVDEGKHVATIFPDILARYNLAADSAITAAIPADEEGVFTPDGLGLRFQSLEHLTISLEYHSYLVCKLPEDYEKWISVNLFARRICGIGLKKMVYVLWSGRDTGALNVACRVVDDIEKDLEDWN
ncbi:hypothetical protein BDN72DRAFT_837563 [Pluteus cervinus]|uniref:Uncharacterized protein n=1 Tax=Pluteus cervinus TaxID=181527 RepID=A0ACD3AZT6_9AGAR|nr:hypothetical protein BDN72DRAFT_837563 [Pluteus cervinus]